MSGWLNRILNRITHEPDLAHLDPTDLASTLNAARHISRRRENRGTVVVVVEIAAEFNVATGCYGDYRYNFYTYRGARDFDDMKNLKAAFLDGERVDANDRCNSGHLVTHAVLPTVHGEVSIREGDPLAAGGRKPAVVTKVELKDSINLN